MQRTALILGLCLISTVAWLGESAAVGLGTPPCATAKVMEGCCCAPRSATDSCPCDVAPDPLPVLPLHEERTPNRSQAWTLPEFEPLLETVSVTTDEDSLCGEASDTCLPVPTRHMRRLALIGVFRN